MNIASEVDNNDLLLSIFSEVFYQESISELIDKLQHRHMCYVTLNNTADSLQKLFKRLGIPRENMLFIDAVSRARGLQDERDNTVFVSGPDAFQELDIAMEEVLKHRIFDVVLFDSISRLSHLHEDAASSKFVHALTKKIKTQKKKGIFICLENDLETIFMKQTLHDFEVLLSFNSYYDQLRKNQAAFSFRSMLAVGLVMVLPLLVAQSQFGNLITGFVVQDLAGQQASLLSLFVFGVLIFAFLGIQRKRNKMLSAKIVPLRKTVKENTARVRHEVRAKIKKWLLPGNH